jgi:hypothetical protein
MNGDRLPMGQRALIYVEPHNAEARRASWRRCLLHAGEKGYDIVGLAEGKEARLSIETMLATGEVDVVVTSGGTVLDATPGVEIAGAGRLRLTTYSRGARLRAIADLIDSGLSDEAIVRTLRADAGRGHR